MGAIDGSNKVDEVLVISFMGKAGLSSLPTVGIAS